MKKYVLVIIFFYQTLQINAQTVSDVDGNTYNTVTIGTQVWMAQNLKTTHYANGDPILKVTGNSNWDTLTATSKAYCWYYDDSINYSGTYGALYTWAAAMKGAASSLANPSGIQGVCPSGWHIPSAAEWSTMQSYLVANGYNYDGTTTGNKIAKALATTNWSISTNAGAVGNTDYPSYCNKTGFTAVPAGFRNYSGLFGSLGSYTYWWSTSEGSGTGSYSRYLCFYQSNLGVSLDFKDGAISVRCVNNIPTSINMNTLNYSYEKIIYPNPANNRLYIKNNNNSFNVFIIIFDLQGKQVFNKQIDSDYINISNLSKGIYLVKIVDSGNVVITKLIKN